MKFYSEDLQKLFDSEEDLVEAEEKAYIAKQEAEEKSKKLAEDRKLRAKEVEDAYKLAVEAQNNYLKLRNEFIRDYNSYHITYSNVSDYANNIFENFFKIF